jgi:hypothetical protein
MGDTPTLCGTVCVDTDTDPENCGACAGAGGDVCGTDEICVTGACVPDCTGATPTLCGAVCVDTDTDPEHCGACADAGGDLCMTDEVCEAGSCVPACDSGLTYCDGACVDTDTDPDHCGACASAGGVVCAATESCVMGSCVSVTCDDFERPDSTTVSGWTERMGDFLIDSGRLYTTATTGVYENHITFDGSTQLDGCTRLRAIYGPGTNLKSIGAVARWTAGNSYVVGLVQDNHSSGSGQFDAMWIYEYPGGTRLADLRDIPMGTDLDLEMEVVGSTVTLRVDSDRDGTWDHTLTATTSKTSAGLSGAMGLAFGSPAYIDDFCWGCP